MFNPLLTAGVAAAIIVLVMLAAWWRQRITKNANIVDALWAVGVGAVATLALATGAGDDQRRLITALVIGLWSGRLSWYLFRHRVGAEVTEDGRYATLRAEKGDAWNSWALLFFMGQAGFVMLFAIPAFVIAADPSALGRPGDIIGLIIAAAALFNESLADRQLRLWRADPANKGRTCRQGWWRYSRHPNYFFEWLFWCGIACLAIPGSYAWLAIAQVVIVFLLIRYMTGIPYTEKQAIASRGEDYRNYQATTSAFIPWFPTQNPGSSHASSISTPAVEGSTKEPSS